MTVFTDPPRLRSSTIEDFSVTTAETQVAFGNEAIRFSPVPSIYRGFEQYLSQQDETSPVLEEEEQDKLYKEAGVKLKSSVGLRRQTLDLLVERKQAELADKAVIAKASTSQFIGGLGASFVVAAFDPLNIASAFIPVVKPAQYLASLASKTTATGRALTRARLGGLQGFAGAVVVEPFVAFQASQEQSDYTMADTLVNFAFGTALGGGLHAGIGVLSDGFSKGRLPSVSDDSIPQMLSALSVEQRDVLGRVNLALGLSDRIGIPPVKLIDLMGRSDVVPPSFRSTVETGPLTFPRAALGEQRGLEVGLTEPLPKTAEQVARETRSFSDTPEFNPDIFKTFDNLEVEQARLRQQLEATGKQREKSPELKKLDEEIARVTDKKAKANADGKAKVFKKLERQLDRVTAQRDKLIRAKGTLQDTPVMKKIRDRLIDVDTKMRELAPQISSSIALTKAEMPPTPNLAFEPRLTDAAKVEIERAQSASAKSEIERAQSVENLRFADVAAKERVDNDILPSDAFDSLPQAEASLKEQQTRLEEIIAQSDPVLAEDFNAIVRDEVEVINLDIKQDEAYAKGLRARALCDLKGIS